MASRRVSTLIKSALTSAIFLSCAPAAQADGIAGPYLAARQAALASNYSEAAHFYTRAMAARPDDLQLKEAAVLSLVASGDISRAANIAREHRAAGGNNQIIDLILMTQKIKDGDYSDGTLATDSNAGIAPLIGGLIKAWSHLGQGDMTNAIAAFGAVAEIEDFAGFAYYHQALALAMVGDFETADTIFSGEAFGPLALSSRGIMAHAQVLSQLERNNDAVELLTVAGSAALNPDVDKLLYRAKAGELLPFEIVTGASDGIAEVFYNLSSALANQASPDHVLLYARLAQYLRPDHAPAILTIAEILEQLRQYELAATAYANIPQEHPAYYIAEMGRADVLFASGREDAAAEVLTALARAVPNEPIVHAALGDLLGRLERDAEAIAAYTRSLELRPSDQPSAWGVYYARGIIHEREGDFAGMERDFRKALELSPDQPDVLNYLGYSLVEQRTKLPEALEMIKTAVEKRPESGYITDSLGWVYYRLGQFEEAVGPMERAVELLPIDPIVNDHLGDVYWMVGRYREAEFQWKRALSFEPEEADAERIRRKLDVGLDVVLKEEDAAGDTQTAND